MRETARYRVLRKIAHGGMAEIFLALQLGVEGFQKQVVLKRILPALAADPSFVRMLVDEAHIASTLNHVSFTLGTVIVGVKAIGQQVEPVPKYVGIILNDVTAIDQAAKQLLAWGERSGADFAAAYGTTSRVAAT